MKKWLQILIGLVMIVALVACGVKDEPTTSADPTAKWVIETVAFAIPTKISETEIGTWAALCLPPAKNNNNMLVWSHKQNWGDATLEATKTSLEKGIVFFVVPDELGKPLFYFFDEGEQQVDGDSLMYPTEILTALEEIDLATLIPTLKKELTQIGSKYEFKCVEAPEFKQ